MAMPVRNPIPPAPVSPAQSLADFAAAKLDRLAASHLLRQLEPTARLAPNRAVRGGRELISFACNDYLNLSHHRSVRAAAIAAIETYGAGAGASRLVSGDHPLYAELEERLARLKGTAACCVFGSGYLANIGIIPALAGAGDLVAMDELGHACMGAGARLSRSETVSFRHNDVADLRKTLAARRARSRHCLILTERVFSMDGDLAPLAALAEAAEEFDAWLMVDDAHGLGVLPPGGNEPAVPLQMGTLSKAVGAYGGYLCAAMPVIELMRNRARSFIYTTGLPPAAVAAAIAALDVMASEPDLVGKPLAKARLFTTLLDLPPAQSAIVPLIIGDEKRALAAAAALGEQGFLVVAIRPPTVPPGTARLRFAFAAQHDDDDIRRLAAAVQTILAKP